MVDQTTTTTTTKNCLSFSHFNKLDVQLESLQIIVSKYWFNQSINNSFFYVFFLFVFCHPVRHFHHCHFLLTLFICDINLIYFFFCLIVVVYFLWFFCFVFFIARLFDRQMPKCVWLCATSCASYFIAFLLWLS